MAKSELTKLLPSRGGKRTHVSKSNQTREVGLGQLNVRFALLQQNRLLIALSEIEIGNVLGREVGAIRIQQDVNDKVSRIDVGRDGETNRAKVRSRLVS